MLNTRVVDELRKRFGSDQIGLGDCQRLTYGSDLWPRNQIWKQAGEFGRYKADVVFWPESVGDVEALVSWCDSERIPLVPVGAGSGVCGGALPLEGGVVIDMKRMRRLLLDDRDAMRIEVEPGFNGLLLEESLQRRGLTLGHYPSSIACSTAGGWVAARGAGQYSSKYGKIEDLVTGLEVVTPGRGRLRTGELGEDGQMDPWTQVFVGSEGTLGVITRIRLKVRQAPVAMDFHGFGFRDLRQALACMQGIMQERLAPAVLRLYDPFDSLVAGFHREGPGGEDVSRAAAKVRDPILSRALSMLSGEFEEKGLLLAIRRPELLNRIAHWLPVPCLVIVGDEGSEEAVKSNMGALKAQAMKAGGRDLGPGPGRAWHANRYAISYKQSKIFQRGAFVDTMEVATTWDRVHDLYQAVVRALSPMAFVMAHFSHAYEDGCSIYFTFVGYRRKHQEQEELYQQVWRAGMGAVASAGATISHHHGVGLLKKGMMPREWPGGEAVFSSLKTVFDPSGVMNPGKLWDGVG